MAITIKGKFNNAIIFTDSLDKGSEGLVTALCDSPISEGSKIRIMPDVHPGKGCVIGTTMTITDKIAPGLLGVDIGCGITATKIGGVKNLNLDKLDKIIKTKIPSGMSIRDKVHKYAEKADIKGLNCVKHIQLDKAYRSIGTLGGGNHFIEIDKDEYGEYYILIHSGSRHLGVEVEKYYHDLAYSKTKDKVPYEFAYLEGQDMQDYIADIKKVQYFAHLNKYAILDEICKAMKYTDINTIRCDHNYLNLDGATPVLHKGSISAKKKEPVVIPLNMRDGAIIGCGKGNAEWNFSAPHGAGRLYSRSEVANNFTLSQFKNEMRGVYSTSISRDTLDESPMAYKNSDMILNAIEDTVQVLEIIKPVYNFKAGSAR